jgi:uncharacterized protein
MTTPASPCVSNCCLNKEDICLGCFRSLTEITGWSQASDLGKQAIIVNTKLRREKLKPSLPLSS